MMSTAERRPNHLTLGVLKIGNETKDLQYKAQD
jgi:hypothetical protein